jgi:flavodoxin
MHVSRAEIDEAVRKLAETLKLNGVLYASFKYGDAEYTHNNRFFNCYNETTIKLLLKKSSNLNIKKIWQTKDSRINMPDSIWLNVLAEKPLN